MGRDTIARRPSFDVVTTSKPFVASSTLVRTTSGLHLVRSIYYYPDLHTHSKHDSLPSGDGSMMIISGADFLEAIIILCSGYLLLNS